ncbi:MAG: prolipoprotein diacylglyceryl transferase [Candidatus Moraniibacteriota bacterium]
MNNFLEFYQHIPEHINPEIFHIGSFSFGWYATMYLVAFFVIFGLLKKRLKLGEGKMSVDQLFEFLLVCFLGAVIGGRFGYVLFYNFPFYLAHPLAIVSPFDPVTGELIGIYGMSYHGGLIGALIGAWIFVRKNNLNFWLLSDFVIPAIPAGYFFGRIGNFLNGELYGRATNSRWGMYFPSDDWGILRQPSQLYEAFLEGVVLFLIFWFFRNKKSWQGNFLALYLVGYSLMRFSSEFFREPDAQIGFLFGWLTLGQLFSVGMLSLGVVILFWKKKKVCYNKKAKN